ncbi:MAG: hypothetical protein HGA86_06825 [Anaerolineaceae bacterium]|nr:hypothetical protein [Anaerolineaceae bacterium]
MWRVDSRAVGINLRTVIIGEPKIGKIASARVVQIDDDVTFISNGGIMLRLKVKVISESGRSTRGVHIMDLPPGKVVASVAKISAADLASTGDEKQAPEES